MADINLSAFSGDEFVFHFGGRPSEVDAYTFANSLIAFSEAIREINSQTNPDTKLEITIDGIGEGSFVPSSERRRLRFPLYFVPAL